MTIRSTCSPPSEDCPALVVADLTGSSVFYGGITDVVVWYLRYLVTRDMDFNLPQSSITFTPTGVIHLDNPEHPGICEPVRLPTECPINMTNTSACTITGVQQYFNRCEVSLIHKSFEWKMRGNLNVDGSQVAEDCHSVDVSLSLEANGRLRIYNRAEYRAFIGV